MFSKPSSFAFAVILAVATPVLGQCDTSSKAMCCDSVEPAGSITIAPLLAAIGVVVQYVNVPVGVDCSPITVIGAGSSECGASPVCCTDTSHGQLQLVVFQSMSLSKWRQDEIE